MEIIDLDKELEEFLNERVVKLDVKLRAYDRATQKLLMSIPGVGPQTAVTCISEVADITRFPDAQKLTPWLGLDPRVHQSGTSINGKGYITKRGNKLLHTPFQRRLCRGAPREYVSKILSAETLRREGLSRRPLRRHEKNGSRYSCRLVSRHPFLLTRI